MNNYQKLLVIIVIIVLLLMIIYPPFCFTYQGMTFNLGYSFIMRPPIWDYDLTGAINTKVLLIQYLFTCTIGAGILHLLKGNKSRKANTQNSHGSTKSETGNIPSQKASSSHSRKETIKKPDSKKKARTNHAKTTRVHQTENLKSSPDTPRESKANKEINNKSSKKNECLKDYLIPTLQLIYEGYNHTEAFHIVKDHLDVRYETVSSQCTRALGLSTNNFIAMTKDKRIIQLLKEKFPDRIDFIDEELPMPTSDNKSHKTNKSFGVTTIY